jgi:hypothetical protein
VTRVGADGLLGGVTAGATGVGADGLLGGVTAGATCVSVDGLLAIIGEETGPEDGAVGVGSLGAGSDEVDAGGVGSDDVGAGGVGSLGAGAGATGSGAEDVGSGAGGTFGAGADDVDSGADGVDDVGAGGGFGATGSAACCTVFVASVTGAVAGAASGAATVPPSGAWAPATSGRQASRSNNATANVASILLSDGLRSLLMIGADVSSAPPAWRRTEFVRGAQAFDRSHLKYGRCPRADLRSAGRSSRQAPASGRSNSVVSTTCV